MRPVDPHLANVNGRCLTRVTGVLLEREAEDGYLLLGDGVEHGTDDTLNEPAGAGRNP